MTHVHTHNGWRSRIGALALLAVLVGACDGADDLTNVNPPESTLDAVASDAAAVPSETAALDALLADSAALDAAIQLSPEARFAEANMYARAGMAFGPEGLWSGYTSLRSRAIPFTASTNFTDPYGIVKQINAARAMRQRLVLNMTGGGHFRYKTAGKFDFRKWKAVMNRYNTRAIKSAVARGVADGTIIMNTVMDEPNVKSWGGVMTKPLLDQMARYVKAMFPTLPVGVALRTDWRTHERFRVMDAYIAQYSWYRGKPTAFRDHGLSEARKQGMKVVFALNILDGGVHTFRSRWSCPTTTTGGKGTYAPACRMTANQVRDWGRVLGTAGCGLLLWKYDGAFMSRAANVRALKDVASTLARTPGRSCRRG
jgi:hypothetical protein